MDEHTRRVQISLRMKAGRYLAGSWKPEGRKRGAIPLPTAALARRPALLDEQISDDRLQSIEQIKAGTSPPARSELRAIITALNLPDDWFDGLYPSDRGQATTVLGLRLLEVAEVAREHRQAREEGPRTSDGTDPPGQAGEGAGG